MEISRGTEETTIHDAGVTQPQQLVRDRPLRKGSVSVQAASVFYAQARLATLTADWVALTAVLVTEVKLASTISAACLLAF